MRERKDEAMGFIEYLARTGFAVAALIGFELTPDFGPHPSFAVHFACVAGISWMIHGWRFGR